MHVCIQILLTELGVGLDLCPQTIARSSNLQSLLVSCNFVNEGAKQNYLTCSDLEVRFGDIFNILNNFSNLLHVLIRGMIYCFYIF